MVVKDYVKIKDKGNLARIENIFHRITNPELSKVMLKWKRDLSTSGKIKTLASYLHLVEVFFRDVKKSVDKITPNDLKKYFGKLVNNGQISKARLTYSALLNFYRFYEDLGKKEYPARFRKVDNPKPVHKETEPLDYDSEIKPIIAAWSDNTRNQAAIHVLYEAMLRKMELLALRVCDIDLTKKPAPVNVRISKTERGKKRPTFIYNAIPVLKEWLNKHPMRTHKDFQTMPLFCTNKKGSAMLEGTLRTIITEGAKRAGIKRNIYPHLFRHSRAYELAQVYHFSPQELKKAGGWVNSNMLDTYYNPKARDIKNKILNGHGIKTISQEEREEALKDRQIRLCACGCENSYDTIFCKDCGVILNIKQYNKEIKSKDDTIDDMKNEMLQIKDMLKQMALSGQFNHLKP